MTYRDAMKQGEKILEKASVENGETDSRLLLEYVSGMDMSNMLLHVCDPMPQEQEHRFWNLIQRRAKRIPLQHLTGSQEFMGLMFSVNEDVLIPRQDTELLVEVAISAAPENGRVLDLCTGSGCIAVSLAHYRPDLSVEGSDISEKALTVAAKNSEQNGCTVSWIQSNLFEELSGFYDLIVSNPPYIPTSVIATLMPEVRDHDPVLALDGKDDGLYFYRRIVSEASQWMQPEAGLLMEIGYDQADAVEKLLTENGFTDVSVRKDLSGLDRVICARLASSCR